MVPQGMSEVQVSSQMLHWPDSTRNLKPHWEWAAVQTLASPKHWYCDEHALTQLRIMQRHFVYMCTAVREMVSIDSAAAVESGYCGVP
jgi:hypothetical protein